MGDCAAEVKLKLVKMASDLKEKTRFKILRPVGDFPPSRRMQEAQLKYFSNAAVAENNPIIRDYLATKILKASNYYAVMNTLLEMEDLNNIVQYKALIQRNIKINGINIKKYSICAHHTPKHILEQVLCPQFDEVLILPKNSIPYLPVSRSCVDVLLNGPLGQNDIPSATVIEINKKKNIVTFKFEKAPNIPVTENYDFIFRPSRIPERYQYTALNELRKFEYIQNYLFPSAVSTSNVLSQSATTIAPIPNDNGNTLNLINTAIANNPEQLTAIHYILNGLNKAAPYIVFGPPGTGKTTTIVEAILQLRIQQPHSRILIAAGSNSASDTIALRLCQYYVKQLGDERIENTRHIIRLFGKSILVKGLHTVDPLLLGYSNCANFSGEFVFPCREIIREYGIIVSTLCTVGKLASGCVGDDEFFTHIFIDEAAASTEAECLVGLMNMKFSDKCSVILSGDHKQLGPVIKLKLAAEHGLSLSLMERLLRTPCYQVYANGSYDKSLQIRLRRNYRSHPAIVQVYNQLYYDNELIPHCEAEDADALQKWPFLRNSEFPIIFQAVYGELNTNAEKSTSSHNNLEIRVLVYYIESLLYTPECQVKSSDIGIITPYKLQSEYIKRKLKEHNINGIEVGSVENYQGREKRIIIVSLVRSFSSLGFVTEPRRLNVMLSRAQSLLVLIGNPKTLKQNDDFNFIINECQSHGTFVKKYKAVKAYARRIRKSYTDVRSPSNSSNGSSTTQTDSDDSRDVVEIASSSSGSAVEDTPNESDEALNDIITLIQRSLKLVEQ